MVSHARWVRLSCHVGGAIFEELSGSRGIEPSLEKVLLDQKLDDLELEVEYLYWTDERLGLV